MSGNPPGFMVIWDFKIRPGCEVAFERAYGPDGDWVRLFSKGDGYAGTELWEDNKQPDHYIVVDKWRSELDYRRFKSQHAEAYLALDRECLALTDSENCLGMFSAAP